MQIKLLNEIFYIVLDCDGKKATTIPMMFEGFSYFKDDDENGFILRCGGCPFIVEHVNLKTERCATDRKMRTHIRGKHLGINTSEI